jgi:hypothetical protein
MPAKYTRLASTALERSIAAMNDRRTRKMAFMPAWRPLYDGMRGAAAMIRGMPGRYAAVVVGGALLLVGCYAGSHLGTAAPGAMALLGTAATASGLVVLLGASLHLGAPAWVKRAAGWARWPAVALGGLLTLGTLGILLLGTASVVAFDPPGRAYWTDTISFTHVDADLVVRGQNPYADDAGFVEALRRYPGALPTPLRHGAFGTGDTYPSDTRIAAVERAYLADAASADGSFDARTLHSYPALAFLLYVPFVWAGLPSILWLHLLVYVALFAWLVALAPARARPWAALAAAAALSIEYSLPMDIEIVCVALLLAAWHLRDRRWAGAALLGAACAFKQYCWLFAPFFAVEWGLRYGWREAARRSGIALGAFLLPNLPYLVASPGAWWSSLWLPLDEPLFPSGIGVVALARGGLLPFAPPAVYAVLEALALVAALWAALHWRDRLGDAVLLLPLVPLFFAFRSLPSYFAFAPWLALYAVNGLYARWSVLGRAQVVAAAGGASASRNASPPRQPSR